MQNNCSLFKIPQIKTTTKKLFVIIKKSELYSSLWASCNQLRGGMDASQYKDYVLVMLFIKYISDKYYGEKYSLIEIPQGSSFANMVALKGDANIGEKINKQIIAPIADKNQLSAMPDFNDPNKLGSGKDMVDRLTNLIAIFENPDFQTFKNEIDNLQNEIENINSQIAEITEENNADEGVFASLDSISKKTVSAELKVIKATLKQDKSNQELQEKQKICEKYLNFCEQQSDLSKKFKEKTAKLDGDLLTKFKQLTEAEVKILVIEDKWMNAIKKAIDSEMQHISQRLNQKSTLPEILN